LLLVQWYIRATRVMKVDEARNHKAQGLGMSKDPPKKPMCRLPCADIGQSDTVAAYKFQPCGVVLACNKRSGSSLLVAATAEKEPVMAKVASPGGEMASKEAAKAAGMRVE